MFAIIFCFCVTLVIEILYVKLADHYNIIDKPNSRSSHTSVIIRGGGIIFPIAFLLPLFFETFTDWLFIGIGLLSISIISFLDDLLTLNNKIRILVQSLSVGCLLIPIAHDMHLFWLITAFIFITGVINAYNFMDGINGITAIYSLVSILTLFWISHYYYALLPDIYFMSVTGALLIFSFCNLRKKAICFAGDVGSIAMAFILCFLIIGLMIQTRSVIWILLLAIYGIDAVITIIFRLIRKENIFQAHRSHLYQFLANDKKMSHILISFIYGAAQLLCNIFIIWSHERGGFFHGALTLSVFILIYLIIRFKFEGRSRLLTAY